MPALREAHPPRAPRPERLSLWPRAGLALLAGACLALLLIASRLSAAPAGHGTHMQLGLPPCGWVQAWGKPCMTCGMTTAFAAATHQSFWTSVKAQPMGAAFALCASMLVWLGGYSALTGSMIVPTLLRIGNWRLVWSLIAGLLLAWGYKWITFTP